MPRVGTAANRHFLHPRWFGSLAAVEIRNGYKKVPMRQFIFAVQILVSGQAADWVFIDWSPAYSAYADPTTVRQSGERVRMWTLTDYRSVQTYDGSAYLSNKAEFENDCQAGRVRMLAFFLYSEAKGSGKVIHSDAHPGNWQPIMPDTIGQTMWKFACDKKYDQPRVRDAA